MPRKLKAVLCLLALLSPLPTIADFDPATAKLMDTADLLIERALKDDLAYRIVAALTTEIGPRLAGTPQEERARVWALRMLEDLGFKRVRIEPFDLRPWTRGVESAEITGPFPQALAVTALGNSIATPRHGIEGEVIRFATIAELIEAPDNPLQGKIVFVDEMTARTQDGEGYRIAVPRRTQTAIEAGKRGALGALIRSTATGNNRFPHTGSMRYAENIAAVPIAALSAPDADQLGRALDRGPVRVKLVLDLQGGGRTDSVWEGRPGQLVESGNVVAEIPGKTDEIVLVGAHLDSWDLGTGAVDDGAGVAIVSAAAKLVAELRGKPRRTIRVVLFGSEEVEMAGAHAYAQRHADSLDKHVIAAESDMGAGRIWRFQTRWGADKLHKTKIFTRVLGRLHVVPGNNEAYGGPDMRYLLPAGVPVVTLTQDGSDYYDLHHSANDTLDKIDQSDLAQNVAAYAAFIYLAAELDGGFRAGAE